MSSVRVYVDLDDVYDEMDRRDKENMAQWLFEDGFLESHTNPKIKMIYSDKDSYMEDSFKKTLGSLWDKYYQMSEEDIQLIENLSKKY
jgi:hypothetical protein